MYSKTSHQVNTLYALLIYKMLSSLNYKLFTWHRGWHPPPHGSHSPGGTWRAGCSCSSCSPPAAEDNRERLPTNWNNVCELYKDSHWWELLYHMQWGYQLVKVCYLGTVHALYLGKVTNPRKIAIHRLGYHICTRTVIRSRAWERLLCLGKVTTYLEEITNM